MRAHGVVAWAMAAAVVAAIGAAGCGKREKPNANRDLQRRQEELMAEMDRIAAEEARKKEGEAAGAAGTTPSTDPRANPGSSTPSSPDPPPVSGGG